MLSKTLECNPAKRYQRAGESAAAFERALQVLEWVVRSSTPRLVQLTQMPPLTLPRTVNRFEEAGMPSEK